MSSCTVLKSFDVNNSHAYQIKSMCLRWYPVFVCEPTLTYSYFQMFLIRIKLK